MSIHACIVMCTQWKNEKDSETYKVGKWVIVTFLYYKRTSSIGKSARKKDKNLSVYELIDGGCAFLQPYLYGIAKHQNMSNFFLLLPLIVSGVVQPTHAIHLQMYGYCQQNKNKTLENTF